MRGRKPKPMALKLLHGDQPCRMNHAEPKMPPGSLDAPEWLQGLALAHWNEFAPVLSAAGLLTQGDRAAFAQLCDDYATIRNGLGDRDKARDRYRRMLVEFGLTPSSRARIKITVEPPRDRMAEFLEKQRRR